MHTYRAELASAQVNGQTYACDYDNIGNRRMSIDASDYAFYEANNLNQYTSIQRNEEEAFVPTFDADGNQTLVRTATGIWSVSYNAENRPEIFQKNTDSVTTRITCTYDSIGRRATKKVEEITTDVEGNESSTLISHHRFIYRGYLQIACCDLTRAAQPCLWLITWDPTQPVATRPLAIQKDGSWFCYGWDLTKNICEVFGQNGYIRTAYSYTPYGNVTATGDITQPIQWSSEYNDIDLALVYYNFRHYNPVEGRWLGRDLAEEYRNFYYYLQNNPLEDFDVLGKDSAKQRKKEETKKRRLANKEGRKINKEHAYHEYKTECQKHGENIQKTIYAQQNILTTKATGLGNIDHIFEAAIGSMELIHNSKEASVEKGIKLCHNAIANNHKKFLQSMLLYYPKCLRCKVG